jgi:hypothetical protein
MDSMDTIRGNALIAASNFATVMFEPSPEQVISLAEMFTTWISSGKAPQSLAEIPMASSIGEELTEEQLKELRDKASQERVARKAARKQVYD